MTLKETIRRILREENEKTPKSKLLKILNKPNGLVKLLNGGFTIEDICDIMEMSEKELYQEYLLKINKRPFIEHLMKMTKNVSIIHELIKYEFGENAKLYRDEDQNFYEIYDETIDHPGGTMVYWEQDDDWEEFEYKPNGIVLVTDETGTREEQW
jgi:hypothetical protein